MLHSRAQVPDLVRAARRSRRRIPVHIMVDTGMGRFGALPQEAGDMASELAAAQELSLQGVATHLACAAARDPGFTCRQLEAFEGLLRRLRAAGRRGSR